MAGGKWHPTTVTESAEAGVRQAEVKAPLQRARKPPGSCTVHSSGQLCVSGSQLVQSEQHCISGSQEGGGGGQH